MRRNSRGRTTPLTTLLLLAVVACCGCSVTVYAGKTTSGPSLSASTAVPTVKAATPVLHTAEYRVFLHGVQHFCRAFYVQERVVDERHPVTGAATRRAETAAQAAGVRRANTFLTGLHPPASLTDAFTEFQGNALEIYRARRLEAQTRTPEQFAAAGTRFEDAINERHALARALGARGCDGVLPSGQARAAVAVVEKFDHTTNPFLGCHTMVTSEFVETEFAHDPGGPMGFCETRLEQLAPSQMPEGIHVVSVSGVEGIAATVQYYEVGCACPAPVTARLYLEGHTWKIRGIDPGEPSIRWTGVAIGIGVGVP